jgi:hypothetical protein
LDEILVSIRNRLINSVEDELKIWIQDLKKVQEQRISAVLKCFGQRVMSEESKFEGVKLFKYRLKYLEFDLTTLIILVENSF